MPLFMVPSIHSMYPLNRYHTHTHTHTHTHVHCACSHTLPTHMHMHTHTRALCMLTHTPHTHAHMHMHTVPHTHTRALCMLTHTPHTHAHTHSPHTHAHTTTPGQEACGDPVSTGVLILPQRGLQRMEETTYLHTRQRKCEWNNPDRVNLFFLFGKDLVKSPTLKRDE